MGLTQWKQSSQTRTDQKSKMYGSNVLPFAIYGGQSKDFLWGTPWFVEHAIAMFCRKLE